MYKMKVVIDYILAVFCVGVALVPRLLCPELTEFQLLIRFWWLYFICIVAVFAKLLLS